MDTSILFAKQTYPLITFRIEYTLYDIYVNSICKLSCKYRQLDLRRYVRQDVKSRSNFVESCLLMQRYYFLHAYPNDVFKQNRSEPSWLIKGSRLVSARSWV
jgi:hypothetical protein